MRPSPEHLAVERSDDGDAEGVATCGDAEADEKLHLGHALEVEAPAKGAARCGKRIGGYGRR